MLAEEQWTRVREAQDGVARDESERRRRRQLASSMVRQEWGRLTEERLALRDALRLQNGGALTVAGRNLLDSAEAAATGRNRHSSLLIDGFRTSDHLFKQRSSGVVSAVAALHEWAEASERRSVATLRDTHNGSDAMHTSF